MNFKGALKIPALNSFVKLIPAKFQIMRLERATPIERLSKGDPIRNPLINKSVI